MATVASPMTTDDLLALPEDGTERWLIAGKLRQRPLPPPNRFRRSTSIQMASALAAWLESQPEPRGQMLTGDVVVRLRCDPDTSFGVDLTYVSAEVLARQSADSTIIDGVPTLVAEILSPNDTIENVNEKIDAYLAAGVPLVWILDTHRRTVTVHSPGAEPVLFNAQQESSGDPHLPGFRVPVRSLFG
jgi:Uma2 family endonuclease